jgi:hypothetical protein
MLGKTCACAEGFPGNKRQSHWQCIHVRVFAHYKKGKQCPLQPNLGMTYVVYGWPNAQQSCPTWLFTIRIEDIQRLLEIVPGVDTLLLHLVGHTYASNHFTTSPGVVPAQQQQKSKFVIPGRFISKFWRDATGLHPARQGEKVQFRTSPRMVAVHVRSRMARCPHRLPHSACSLGPAPSRRWWTSNSLFMSIANDENGSW